MRKKGEKTQIASSWYPQKASNQRNECEIDERVQCALAKIRQKWAW